MRVIFLILLAWAIPLQASEGPRFYNQAEWGQKTFVLQRQADGSLRVDMPAAGQHEFTEDELAVDGWTSLEATWSNLGRSKLRPFLVDQQGNRWVADKPAQSGENSWSPNDFSPSGEGSGPNGVPAPQKLLQVGWMAFAIEPDQHPVLQSCVLNVAVGSGSPRSFALFNERTKPYPFYLPKPTLPADLPSPSLATPRVFLPQDGRIMARPEWRDKWLQWGRDQFPGQFGIDAGTFFFPDLAKTVIAARQDGIATVFELHRSHPYRTTYTRNNGLTQTRFDGFNPSAPFWPPNPGMFDSTQLDDITNEAVFDMTRDKMNALYDLGFQDVFLIDYVWMCFNGKWGYGPSAVALWKDYLKGRGHPLPLTGPDETWKFADYWSYFTSIPLVPAEFGWKTWDDFVPGTEAEAQHGDIGARRLMLLNALYHFHHLVFCSRLTEVAQHRNREMDVAINPEDIGNGGDFTLLGRLPHLGSVLYEFFQSPKQIGSWSHIESAYRWKKGGPYLDLVGELNAGGGGEISRYDRDVAYAFYYDVTAATLPRFCNIQYPDSGDWTNWKSLNHDQLDRFDHWFAGSNAFLLRHQEEETVTVPPPTTTVIYSRSVLEYQDSSTGGMGQDGNVGSYLQALNLDFLLVGRDAWRPDRDDHTRTLFFSPSMSTPAELARVKTWISTGEGKTLIMSGGAPWRTDREPDRPSTPVVIWNADRSYRDSIAHTDNVPTIDTFVPLASRKATVTVHLGGQALETSYWEAGIDQKTLLASNEGLPLITEWNVGKNRVFHVTVDLPPRQLSPLGVDLMARVSQLTGTAPFASYLKDWSLDHQVVPGGDVCIAWDTQVLDQQEQASKTVPSYRPEAAMSGMMTRFDRVPLAAPPDLELHVAPNRDYVVYPVFDQQRIEARSSDQGVLKVALHHTPEVIYYGETSDRLESTIKRAAQTYQAVLDRTRKNLVETSTP